MSKRERDQIKQKRPIDYQMIIFVFSNRSTTYVIAKTEIPR